MRSRARLQNKTMRIAMVVFEPLDFLSRLAADAQAEDQSNSLPRVFAPNHRVREQIVRAKLRCDCVRPPDGSAHDFIDPSYSSTNGQYDANCTAAYAWQTQSVIWTQLSGNSNVTLDGAALQ